MTISGRAWAVIDHSSYDNDDGLHVDEWECERKGGGTEIAYLLRETDETGVRWFFTRSIPISAVTLSGGKPLADVAASLIAPPDALVYRGLAHGLDETTDGRYADEPGELQQKTTWDYWDAKHELNLAVERWADGRIDCYHGRRVDPAQITVTGSGAGPAIQMAGATGPVTAASALGATAIVAGIAGVFGLVMGGTVELGLSVAVAAAAVIGLLTSLRGSSRAGLWIAAAIGLGLLFTKFPPLTSLGGLAVMVLVPAAVTRWIALAPLSADATPVRAAFAAVVAATLGAGLYVYFSFAPVPRSFSDFTRALAVAPIAGLGAAVIAWIVARGSRAA